MDSKEATAPAKERHPLDEARDRLLALVPKKRRAVLRARLSQINHKRMDQSAAADQELLRKADPSGRTRGQADRSGRFAAMIPLAETALASTLEASLAAGIRDDAIIAKFAQEDLVHFLSAYAMSRFGHSDTSGRRFAIDCAATAGAIGGRTADKLIVARDTFDQNQPDRVDVWSKRIKRNKVVSLVIAIGLVLSVLKGWVSVGRDIWQELGGGAGKSSR